MKNFLISIFLLLFFHCFRAARRDSLVYSIVKVSVTHDTTVVVTHDSSYVKVDTIKIPIPAPVVTLKGMYTHPNDVTIGVASSEDSYLSWCKREGVNMLNCYARAFLYTDTKRTQLAAFVAKAKNSYGILLVTVDVRFTNSSEYPGWQAYLTKYSKTISVVEPLTEKEPWVHDATLGYDYTGTFYLLRTMSALCKQYGVKLNFYEGWMGNNYNGLSFSQAPVDSMVKYCDRIFISNYISISDYNSTSTLLGKWDNRMDKRCGYIAVAVPRMGKTSMDILELQSLELIKWGAANDFLGTLYACPLTTTNRCNTFYGPTYQDAQDAYMLSTVTVLFYTDLTGKVIFYSTYAKKAHPLTEGSSPMSIHELILYCVSAVGAIIAFYENRSRNELEKQNAVLWTEINKVRLEFSEHKEKQEARIDEINRQRESRNEQVNLAFSNIKENFMKEVNNINISLAKIVK